MSEAIVELTSRAYDIARAIPPGRVTSYGELTVGRNVFLSLTSRSHCKASWLPELLEVSLTGWVTWSAAPLQLWLSLTRKADCRHVGNALRMLSADSTVPWQVRLSSPGRS